MPDLTAHLTLHDATPSKVVDIMLSHGSIHLLAIRAVIACIEPRCEKWMTPHDCRPVKGVGRCLVTITNVLAPKFVMPSMKSSLGERMTLDDFGNPPFQIMMPLGMLKPHINSVSIRVTTIADHSNTGAKSAQQGAHQAFQVHQANQSTNNEANQNANLQTNQATHHQDAVLESYTELEYDNRYTNNQANQNADHHTNQATHYQEAGLLQNDNQHTNNQANQHADPQTNQATHHQDAALKSYTELEYDMDGEVRGGEDDNDSRQD